MWVQDPFFRRSDEGHKKSTYPQALPLVDISQMSSKFHYCRQSFWMFEKDMETFRQGKSEC